MNVEIIPTDGHDFDVRIDGVEGCNISNGVRFVYRVGDYVVKFPDPREPISYTHDDQAVWDMLDEEDRQYFAPVIEQTDEYVVQQYVELSGHRADNEEAYDTLRYLQEKYGLYDLHDNNWDTTPEGKLIIFDYSLGQSSYPSDYVTCTRCGDRLYFTEACYTGNGSVYCGPCHAESFLYCELCDQDVPRDEEGVIIQDQDYRQVCRDCAKEKLGAVQCEKCEGWFVEDYYVCDDTNSIYCPGCAEGSVHFCEICNGIFEHHISCPHCEFEKASHIHTDVERVHLAWREGPKDVLTRTWRLDCAKGLFVYHAKFVEGSDNSRFFVIHEGSGLCLGGELDSLGQALRVMEGLAELIDWTLPKESIIGRPGLIEKVYKIVADAKKN